MRVNRVLRWVLYGTVAVAALAAGVGIVIGVQAFTSDDGGGRSAVDVAVRTSALAGDVNGLLRELQSPAVANDPERRQELLDQLAERQRTAAELLADTGSLDQTDPQVQELAKTNQVLKDSADTVLDAADDGPDAVRNAAKSGSKAVADVQDDVADVEDDLQDAPPGPGTSVRRLDLDPVDLPYTPFVLRGADDDAFLGAAVDGAGDFDGDGVDDLAVAEPGRQSVAIVYGGAERGERELDDLDPDGATVISGVPTTDDAVTVTGAGDVNGDGLGDVAIGVPGADQEAGSVFVVLGDEDREDVDAGELGDRGFRVDGPGALWRVGSALTAGDLDDDGRSDVVIGASTDYGSVTWALLDAPDAGTSLRLPGRGAASGVWRINGVGTSLDAAHDFNGDGRDDIVGGQTGNDGAAGYAAIVTGSDAAGTVTDATRKAVGVDPITAADDRRYGTTVASIADLDGDARDEAVVYSSQGGRRRAHVVFGTAASTTFDLSRLRDRGATVDVTAPDATVAPFGMAAVGDMDGDDLPELAISGPPVRAPGSASSFYAPGARIVSGAALTRGAHVDATRPSGPVVSVSAFGVGGASPDLTHERAGGILAGAGDFDGDGLADLAVGAPRAIDRRHGTPASPPVSEGAVFVTARGGGEDNPLAGPLTEDGLGDARLGDAPDDVAGALGSVARSAGLDDGDTSAPVVCGEVPTADARVLVWVRDGEIAAVLVSGPGIATGEGVEVGDEETEVRRAYGDRLTTTTVSPDETDATVDLGDDRRLALRLDGDGRVAEMRVGTPTALASEDCA